MRAAPGCPGGAKGPPPKLFLSSCITLSGLFWAHVPTGLFGLCICPAIGYGTGGVGNILVNGV